MEAAGAEEATEPIKVAGIVEATELIKITGIIEVIGVAAMPAAPARAAGQFTVDFSATDEKIPVIFGISCNHFRKSASNRQNRKLFT